VFNTVIDKFNDVLRLERFKDTVSKNLYRYLNKKIDNSAEVSFLNYGFSPIDGENVQLEETDERNRVYIQLYHHVVSRVDLAGRDVLEISSGRGGGAKYIKRYLKARRMCGIDRQPRAVKYCNKQHGEPGLSYICGDAQRLPIDSESCDAVVNVEASHDYMDVPKFLSEVRRVLRPGGHFLYTDFRNEEEVPAWKKFIAESGLTVLEDENITANVAKGLADNTEHNNELVKKLAPRLLRPLFRQFAGVEGSCIQERFATGRSRYQRFLIQKQS